GGRRPRAVRRGGGARPQHDAPAGARARRRAHLLGHPGAGRRPGGSAGRVRVRAARGVEGGEAAGRATRGARAPARPILGRPASIGAAKEEGGCLVCAALAGDARERLVLGTTAHGLVMLNRYPYQNGHLMVAPRRHTADLSSLPVAEHADLAETLRRALASL